jgi:DtxR family Mn-dependent transcriptional regulator
MSVSEMSASAQNYLKTVWGLSEWTSAPVTTTLIADKMGVTLSSASDAVRKLAAQGLVDHAPYGSVTLTDGGRAYALAMVRRHRLIESFLVDVLGYRWDQVHDEAESLEHAVSDFMVERIDALLEFPTRDPHGDPIPSAAGAVTFPDAVQLTGMDGTAEVVVERISDADPTLLQYFQEYGIVLGARLSVRAGARYSDTLEVRVGDVGAPVALGPSATDALYVSMVTAG